MPHEGTTSTRRRKRRRGLDALITCYWKPVYKYVRLRWRENPEDAEDLTQGFFAGASVDATTASITKAGGASVAPKMAIPGVGWAAYFTDPEGNVFGIFQNDPGAK